MAAVQLADTTLFADANLQAYYTLEDVNDDIGANNLTNNNTVTFTTAKFANGANGGATNTNKFLNVANVLGYANAAYSISLWVKLLTEISTGSYDLCELQEATTDTSLLISYEYNSGTRRLNCGKLRAGVAFDGIAYETALGTSIFHHIVLTYDGSTLILYIDNVNVGTVASTGNGTSALTSGLEILSGRAGASGNLTSGIIDDWAGFDRVLTVGDINLLYNGPATGTFMKLGKYQ